MTVEELQFPGSTGTLLAGRLHVPEGGARGSLLLAHCFTCSKDLHTMTRLATGLAEAGYAVLRFDFTGLGESPGEFTATTLAHDVRDLTAAATALLERGYGPCGLLGHSLGGAASLLAAQRLRTVRSVVTLGAPSSPAHVRHLFDDVDGDGPTVTLQLGGRRFEVARSFLDDLETHDQADAICSLARPLMVMHAVDDEIVAVAEGERIFAGARQPKAFYPLLHTDHLLTDRSSAEAALHVIRHWFDATL